VIEQFRLSTHCTEASPLADSRPKRKGLAADARTIEG